MSDLSTYTSVFRANAGYRAKRNRQPVSCTTCQRRKTKCDRQQPCNACWQRGDPDRCRFGPVAVDGGSISGTNGGNGVNGSGGRATGSRQEVQSRLSRLEEIVRELAVETEQQSLEKNSTTEEDTAQDAVENGMRKQSQSLREDRADRTYHGATSWAALVENIRDIQDILGGDDHNELPPPVSDGLTEPEHPQSVPECFLGNPPKITLDDVIESLPTRQNCDKIVATYFKSEFVAIPIIHSHQFRRQYEAFWEEPSSASYLWVSILFSILSLGTAVMNHQSSQVLPDSAKIETPSKYMILAARCSISGEYFRAKPLSAEALLMHVHSRNVCRVDSDPSVWAFYGLAMRIAQRQGYHREMTKVSTRATPFAAEMRRRTWFVLQTMDVLHSTQQGMPPMVDSALCDTLPPTNLTDDDFDEDTVMLPPPRPTTEYSRMLICLVKAPLCHLLDRVLRHALATEPRPYSDVLALHAELEACYASMPLCLRHRSIRSSAFTDPNIAVMHRLLIEVMYRKTLCILHRPYLSSEARTNPQYELSRKACKDAAETVLNIHIELHHEIQPGGRLYEDRYMVNSLTLHDFLIAAMVLSVELSERVAGPPSADSERQISILRKAAAVWSAKCPYSADAQHATRILKAILRKVDSTPPASATSRTESPCAQSSGQTSNSTGVHPNPSAHEWHMNLDENAPFDPLTFSGDCSHLDWTAIDEYLRNSNPDSGFWGMTEAHGEGI